MISPSNLEKLIHTRNNISLYNGFWTDYIAYADENHKFEYIKNVEVMFKYGQISLTPQQIKTIGDRFSSRLDSVPYIKSVYEYCKYMTKFTTTEPQVDNSKTKQNKVPTPQEIKNQIDKLFEDAQKNI